MRHRICYRHRRFHTQYTGAGLLTLLAIPHWRYRCRRRRKQRQRQRPRQRQIRCLVMETLFGNIKLFGDRDVVQRRIRCSEPTVDVPPGARYRRKFLISHYYHLVTPPPPFPHLQFLPRQFLHPVPSYILFLCVPPPRKKWY